MQKSCGESRRCLTFSKCHDQAQQIRALNDDLRKHLMGGGAVITLNIAALGREAVDRIVKTIAVFDDFCHATAKNVQASQALSTISS